MRCAGYEGGGGSSELLPGQGFYDDDEHDVLWFHTKTSPEQSKALLYDDGFVAHVKHIRFSQNTPNGGLVAVMAHHQMRLFSTARRVSAKR